MRWSSSENCLDSLVHLVQGEGRDPGGLALLWDGLFTLFSGEGFGDHPHKTMQLSPKGCHRGPLR